MIYKKSNDYYRQSVIWSFFYDACGCRSWRCSIGSPAASCISYSILICRKAQPQQECLQQYKQQKAEYQASNIRNLYYHNELHRLLSANNIPYVILKGQASAYYYPNPMLRSMGDVDFLVAQSDVNHVDALLLSQGFKKHNNAEKHDYHWAYKKTKNLWRCTGMFQECQKRIMMLLSAISQISSKKRRIIQNSGGEFAIPSDFHHGLVLLLHTISHMTASGVGLRHLCDWLVLRME